MLPLIFLSILLPLTIALPVDNQTSTNVPLTKESWDYYHVDAWLSSFMQKNNLSPANFLLTFPETVHHPLNCDLDQPCTYAPSIAADSSTEKIQISLVLASLAHFNDLFRMISRLWSNDIFLDNPIDPGYPFRTVLVQQFGNIYSDFSISELSSKIPPELIRVFVNSIWYIPGAIPNEGLLKTIENAMATVTKPDWAWKDYLNSDSQGMPHIERTVETLFRAWRQQYHLIVENKGGVDILDFIKDGQMLNIKYAKELTSAGWHTQAYHMFTRQILSLVLEANGLIVHRGNYDNMQPSDTAMGLDFSHNDPYTHETYSPVHFGLDIDGNITRQYSVYNINRTFSYTGVPERVVWGQSWQCFKATNNNDFSSNFVRAWSLPAYNKSLFIPDWDGTTDGFDANNPPCTFNLAVNNQPSDIKTSWYVEQLSAACPNTMDGIMDKYITVDYDLYHAVMLASDAWVYSIVYNRSSNATETLASACQAANSTNNAFQTQVSDDWVSNFEFNLVAGTIAHVGGLLAKVSPVANSIESSIKGGWKSLFKEKPPVVKERLTPPSQGLVTPSDEHSSDPDDECGKAPENKDSGNKLGDGKLGSDDKNDVQPGDSNNKPDNSNQKNNDDANHNEDGGKSGNDESDGAKQGSQDALPQHPEITKGDAGKERGQGTGGHQSGDTKIADQADKGEEAAAQITGL